MTLKITISISFYLLSLSLLLSFSAMAFRGIFLPSSSDGIAYAQLYSNTTTQVWIDKLNNIKIIFSYLPEKPTADDIIQLQFGIQNLQTGSHLKDLIADVTVSNEPLYKFDNVTAPDGYFSLRCPFLDPGTHQLILKVGSKDYALALASFNIPVIATQ